MQHGRASVADYGDVVEGEEHLVHITQLTEVALGLAELLGGGGKEQS